jgi:hypothetical protein
MACTTISCQTKLTRDEFYDKTSLQEMVDKNIHPGFTSLKKAIHPNRPMWTIAEDLLYLHTFNPKRVWWFLSRNVNDTEKQHTINDTDIKNIIDLAYALNNDPVYSYFPKKMALLERGFAPQVCMEILILMNDPEGGDHFGPSADKMTAEELANRRAHVYEGDRM